MQDITATKLRQLMDSGANIVLIDVREPYEHEEFNIGGEVIPLGQIIEQADRFKELGDKEIVLYCRSGNRSAMAQKILASRFGITNTSNLLGGLLAWRESVKE